VAEGQNSIGGKMIRFSRSESTDIFIDAKAIVSVHARMGSAKECVLGLSNGLEYIVRGEAAEIAHALAVLVREVRDGELQDWSQKT
jgi:hypothetical protein